LRHNQQKDTWKHPKIVLLRQLGEVALERPGNKRNGFFAAFWGTSWGMFSEHAHHPGPELVALLVFVLL